MTRVVIDTSVLIRYLIKPSAAVRRLVEDLWINGDVVMVSSPGLIAELEDVLTRDYIRALIRPEEGKAMLDAIRATAEILPPLDEVPAYTRDPKDDKFVACAITGQASYIVTLDKDILALEKLGDLQIVTPYDFVMTRQSS
jgi:putative PIN family toxin of toxin-antitoxin system